MAIKPKVSVLVPAYNVDQYIRKFLDSLVNQTLKNIEIILVNDASPDSCHDIITEFLVDDRIKYINKAKNEGLWMARQSAYDIATGEYIVNLDPDDYIDDNFLESLYVFGKENELDIVVGNVQSVDENDKAFGKTALHKISKRKVLQSDQDYKVLLGTPYASWFRLFKREVMKNFNYNYLQGELVSYTIQFCDGVKVGVNPEVFYYHRKHGASMSNYDKSAKRISESAEFSWDGIHKKLKHLKALPIASENLRNTLYMYIFRVYYSLTMITWLEENPTKDYKKKVGRLLKDELNFNAKNFFKFVSWFKRKEQIFLSLCLLGFDEIVLKELKKRKSN
ncbi:glycosyltransferase family 2 protein [Kriegella aquimaris]|uniref:Glycosyltransferase involved in cell wall bisynthesis n=1 Tax=Kriegella aquimaris TaxID=192904 RepID=A0A1G9JS81_9FLAO|nr:glycosyltransferase family 2 protein [Kriegella aquimaris]SDL40024.1 Glycosyltransferase involved in cell wall bisynthesis [Kriegella aquimaris]